MNTLSFFDRHIRNACPDDCNKCAIREFNTCSVIPDAVYDVRYGADDRYYVGDDFE